MSNIVTGQLWQLQGLTAVQKLVLVKLGDHAWDDGSNIFPSQKTVSLHCGCSVRTVQRVIDWAIGEGLLIEEPGPRNVVRKYRFDMEAVRQRVRATESHTGATHSQVDTTHSQGINKNHQLTINKPSKERKLPNEGECREYAIHLGIPEEAGSDFFNHFEMVGWVYGKSHHPIKDWKRALVTWKKNYKPNLKVERGGKVPDQDGADFLAQWRPS